MTGADGKAKGFGWRVLAGLLISATCDELVNQRMATTMKMTSGDGRQSTTTAQMNKLANETIE